MKISRTLILVLIAFALLPACGRKGDIIVPGTILPQPVEDLSAESRGGAVILAWTMPSKNTSGLPLTDLAGFDVLRAELPENQEGCPCAFGKVGYVDLEFPGTAAVKERRVAWSDRGPALAMGRRYAYKVNPVNKGGFAGADSATAIIRPLTPPAVPTGFTAKPGNGLAVLSWDGRTGDDLAGFDIYRTTGPGEEPARPVNTRPVTGNDYTDPGLRNGVTYYYRITALRGSEPPYTEGEPTSPASVVPEDMEPPLAPVGLRAVPGEGLVLLSWETSPEPDLAGYRIYRQGPGETGLKPLTDGLVNGITYKDASAIPGETYTYAITAVDNALKPNESERSEMVTVTVPGR